MNVLTVASQKGGTGKTTTAVHLAAALELLGRRVLLVDADPQANATYSLGYDPAEVAGWTVAEVVTGAASVRDCAVTTDEGLDLLPGSPGMASAFPVSMGRIMDSYDLAVIDTPTGLSALSVACIQAAHLVLVTVDLRPLSVFEALEQTLTVLKAIPGRRKVRVVPTMIDRRLRVTDGLLGQLNGQRVDRCAGVRVNSTLAEAPRRGETVFRFARSCRGVEDYMALAREVRRLV